MNFDRGDHAVVGHRAVLEDGADLPQNQAVMRPATMVFDPGEIYDFEYTPAAPGEVKLTYGTPPFLQVPGTKLTSVRVRISGATSSRRGGGKD